VRIDRAALIRGLAAAANRERERRQAVEQATAEAAWDQMLSKFAEMAERLAAGLRPDDRELAQRLAQAPDWGHVDELRMAPDRSRAECVALVWIIDPEKATWLLGEYPGYRDA
jgi:tRNA A37 N6-isopentenylltransferase MiaA